MKTTTIRDFRGRIAELIDSDESVLVTRHGKPAAVLYPLGDPSKVPPEVRREIYLEMSAGIARQLQAKGIHEGDIERDFAAHPRDARLVRQVPRADSKVIAPISNFPNFLRFDSFDVNDQGESFGQFEDAAPKPSQS